MVSPPYLRFSYNPTNILVAGAVSTTYGLLSNPRILMFSSSLFLFCNIWEREWNCNIFHASKTESYQHVCQVFKTVHNCSSRIDLTCACHEGSWTWHVQNVINHKLAYMIYDMIYHLFLSVRLTFWQHKSVNHYLVVMGCKQYILSDFDWFLD